MTLTRSLLATAAIVLLSGCAATLTVRNERPGTVKNVQVIAGDLRYEVPELAAGAEDVRQVKVKKAADLNVNYTDENGRSNYTSAQEKLKKGDSRKWLLRLTPKELLKAEIQK